VHSCNQTVTTLTRTHTTQLHCNPMYLTGITQLLTTNIYLNSPPMCKHYQGQSHSRSQYYYGDKASTHSLPFEVTQRVERGLWRQRSKKAIFPCHTRTWETNTLQMATEPFALDSHQFKQLQQMCSFSVSSSISFG